MQQLVQHLYILVTLMLMEVSENYQAIEDKLKKSISLAKRVLYAVDQTKSVPETWFQVEKQVGQLSFMLKTLQRFITTTSSNKKSLYLRPVECIVEEIQGILEQALDIASKFNLKGVIGWFFKTTKTTEFGRLFRNLDHSVRNMKWLVIIYDPINIGGFHSKNVGFLPPIFDTNPIVFLVWSCIATVQMGRQLSDRVDAIMSLSDLAQDNNICKKCIVEEAGEPPLLKLLEENSPLDAKIAAANALCILSNDNPEIMKKIVIVIVSLLKDAPIEIQIQAANLVATMAELNAATEYDSAQGNVIWPLVTLLSSETKLCKRLKISCAEALWMLAARSVSNCWTITETKALLCLAKLVEKERGKLQYYCLMTIMNITAAAESDINFRQAVFKTNSHSAKAVVDQLFRVIEESNDPTMLVPAIKSVGSLARIFPSRETRVIGLLVSMVYKRHFTVATEASIALNKFTCPENYLFEHWNLITEITEFSVKAFLFRTYSGNLFYALPSSNKHCNIETLL